MANDGLAGTDTFLCLTTEETVRFGIRARPDSDKGMSHKIYYGTNSYAEVRMVRRENSSHFQRFAANIFSRTEIACVGAGRLCLEWATTYKSRSIQF
jgi:hypothetical protein